MEHMHTITATTKGATTMTDPAIALLEATERLERAQTEVRIAGIRLDSLVPGAPLSPCRRVQRVGLIHQGVDRSRASCPQRR